MSGRSCSITRGPRVEFAKPSGDSLKNLSSLSPRSLMPTRIRTILIINVVLAVGFTVAQALVKNPAALRIIVPIILIWVLLVAPFMLVQGYLYSKKRGWWYNVRRGPDNAPSSEPRADRGPYKRTRPTDGDVPEESLDRASGLFGTPDGTGRVSRASLLKNVAKQLEAEGKSQAASRCHDLIDERYGNNGKTLSTDDSR